MHYTIIGTCFLFMEYQFAAATCSSYSAHIKETGLQDLVIFGHVLRTITGVDFGECFRQCDLNCHCRSFNLKLGENGVCELNDVDKEEAPGALRAREGFVHVSFKALTESKDTKVAEVCCVENPCRNRGVCVPEIRSGKKSFSCQCLKGYTGKLCEIPVRGCQDYLRANESASSGLYQLWLGEPPMSPKTVYCYFDHNIKEAWTLVMSYSYSHKSSMNNLPFLKDKPINEETPVFKYYRASLASMKYLRKVSTFWRATCNHETKPREDDFMQCLFTTLDIMTFNEHSCQALDVLKLFGTMYRNATSWVVQDTNRIFCIAVTYGSQQAKCPSALKTPYEDEGLFGWFYKSVPQHGCAASSDSTTQYWFGVKL